MPVYNAEKYLNKAVESVLNQRYRDFELILVDDGSTDGSGYICDEYSMKDTRVHTYHKDNGGVSSARRYGYDKTTGEWISFMDNDDVISPYFYEKLMEYSNEAEIVIGRAEDIDGKEFDKTDMVNMNEFITGKKYEFTGIEAAELLNSSTTEKYGIVTLLWGKIISRKVMERAIALIDEEKENIPFNYFEDMYAMPRIFLHSNSVVIRGELMYYHRVCNDSPSHTMVMKQYNYEQIKVGHINLQYYKENNYIELYKGQLPHYYLVILKIWYACNKCESDEAIKVKYSDQINYYYKYYYKDLRKNRYVKPIYRIVIKLFGWNKSLWNFAVGKMYFGKMYKYREKFIN
jgi:glycosyltransferase involved in cell wall biosynthesis